MIDVRGQLDALAGDAPIDDIAAADLFDRATATARRHRRRRHIGQWTGVLAVVAALVAGVTVAQHDGTTLRRVHVVGPSIRHAPTTLPGSGDHVPASLVGVYWALASIDDASGHHAAASGIASVEFKSEHELSWHACNSGSGTVDIGSATLTTHDVSTTMMLCGDRGTSDVATPASAETAFGTVLLHGAPAVWSIDASGHLLLSDPAGTTRLTFAASQFDVTRGMAAVLLHGAVGPVQYALGLDPNPTAARACLSFVVHSATTADGGDAGICHDHDPVPFEPWVNPVADSTVFVFGWAPSTAHDAVLEAPDGVQTPLTVYTERTYGLAVPYAGVLNHLPKGSVVVVRDAAGREIARARPH